MKFCSAIAIAFSLHSSIGMAQLQGDKPLPEQSGEMTIVTGNESRHAHEADARHCLELKYNAAIARCAESYRRIPPPKRGARERYRSRSSLTPLP